MYNDLSSYENINNNFYYQISMNAVIVVFVVTTVTIHKDHTTVTVKMDLCYKMMEKHVKVYNLITC